MKPTLGTQLRHLLELLDGAVEQSYLDTGVTFRPRYTPVTKALMAHEPLTIGDIADAAHITQPAATQTIALMIKEGIVTAEAGADGRQRLIRFTDAGRNLLPGVQACWQATALAAATLDDDLDMSFSGVLDKLTAALEARPFGERIAAARSQLAEIQIHRKPKKRYQP
jgi:MarR family transcriptional regulator, organic hydroperoxide resistance regulator